MCSAVFASKIYPYIFFNLKSLPVLRILHIDSSQCFTPHFHHHISSFWKAGAIHVNHLLYSNENMHADIVTVNEKMHTQKQYRLFLYTYHGYGE